MKNTFTTTNISSMILLDDDNFELSISCALYECYRVRENEADTEIIYLNKQVNNKYTS
jgi:hypothetical protein